MFVLLLLPLVAFCSIKSADAEKRITLGGNVATAASWTAAELEKAFTGDIKTVEYNRRGQKHTSRCVPLLAVLKSGGVPTELKMDPKTDAKSKNFPQHLVVVITAEDGYSAAFSLGELLADIGHHDVWLAIDGDEKPLPDDEAPARLIVPDDQKPSRWIRGIESISVVDAVASIQRR